MDLHLKDKFFVVTGGASGIGAAISVAVDAEGGIPIIVGRNKEKGDQLLSKLNRGYQVIAQLGTIDECKKAVDDILKISSHIHGLVNNAGANDGVGLENGTLEEFLKSLQNNLHHYYHLAHLLLPTLKSTTGSILNVSSKTALTGQGNTSAYAAAKGAQLALTREWAVELLKYNIRVNAIVPSEVMTPLYQSWIDTFEDKEARLESITAKIPLGQRMTTAEEIADTAVFLLSDRASHITGQHLFVDGGYVHLDRALAGNS